MVTSRNIALRNWRFELNVLFVVLVPLFREIECFIYCTCTTFQEERQKRMLATDDHSDEENEEAEKSSSQRPRSISGDDLDDSFLVDEEHRTRKGWVDEILERRDADDDESEEEDSSEEIGSAEDGSNGEESDEDNDEHEDLSLKDWEQSDDDNPETNLGSEEEESEEDDDTNENKVGIRESEEEKNANAVENSIRRKDSSDSNKINADGKLALARLELPYVIEAPKTLEELCALLDNCSNADIILIINRIRASNAIKLAAENRKKMQVCGI